MAAPSSPKVTKLLLAWGEGEPSALEKLIPVVHAELRQIARRYMGGERREHTLQATALLNEAYMRLVDAQQVKWQNRAHFFAISAQLMRRILVDHARSRGYQKRGAGAHNVTFDEGLMGKREWGQDLVALDDALKSLAEFDERKGKVIELRFFGGLSAQETAEVLNVSEDTVLRDWKLAKAWLRREMASGGKYE